MLPLANEPDAVRQLTVLTDSHALCVIGSSGSGKSHLLNSVLDYYGSGIVVLAPGDGEKNSYYPKYKDTEHYDFAAFDDPDFQVSEKSLKVEGVTKLLKFLTEEYTRLRAEYDKLGRVESRKVLAVDTGTGLGQLALNRTFAKFNYDEAPPVRGERGYPFFTYLMSVQTGIFSKLSAIRGLGLHWVMAAQAAEREVTEGQATRNEGQATKLVMPAFPGGFRDKVQQYFDLVVQSQVQVVTGKEPIHRLLALPDTKRVTKSRLGNLPNNLPNEWKAILPKLDEFIKLREAQSVPAAGAAK